MYKKSSQKFGCKVNNSPGGLPGDEGDIRKDDLLHKIVRTDVKHVDGSFGM
ncbi:hypothetical protein MR781_04580 [bacterium]|nr:hypothetical protein [bacterium]MDY4195503.1 hypothetical protein [Bariatricus sp.]